MRRFFLFKAANPYCRASASPSLQRPKKFAYSPNLRRAIMPLMNSSLAPRPAESRLAGQVALVIGGFGRAIAEAWLSPDPNVFTRL